MDKIIIPTEIHLKIMEYLGYRVVLNKYPFHLPKVADFIKKDFIRESFRTCEEFGKSLYDKNSIILSLCMKLRLFERIISKKNFYRILNRVLEQRPPSPESEDESYSSEGSYLSDDSDE